MKETLDLDVPTTCRYVQGSERDRRRRSATHSHSPGRGEAEREFEPMSADKETCTEPDAEPCGER